MDIKTLAAVIGAGAIIGGWVFGIGQAFSQIESIRQVNIDQQAAIIKNQESVSDIDVLESRVNGMDSAIIRVEDKLDQIYLLIIGDKK